MIIFVPMSSFLFSFFFAGTVESLLKFVEPSHQYKIALQGYLVHYISAVSAFSAVCHREGSKSCGSLAHVPLKAAADGGDSARSRRIRRRREAKKTPKPTI